MITTITTTTMSRTREMEATLLVSASVIVSVEQIGLLQTYLSCCAVLLHLPALQVPMVDIIKKKSVSWHGGRKETPKKNATSKWHQVGWVDLYQSQT